MDAATSRKVAQLIAGLVVTDDDLDPAEDVFVDKMLERFGIPSEEREVIFPILDGGEAAESFASLSADVQGEAFDLLLEAAAVDGNIAPEERDYLRQVGKVLALSDEQVDEKLQSALAKA